MRPEAEPTGPPSDPPLADGAALVGAFALAAAGLVHLSVAPAHFEEWWGFGALFLAAAAGQLGLALALLLRPSGRYCRAALALCSGLIAAWLLSRTFGLPLGPDPWTAEAVGLLDGLTTLEELVLVALVAPTAGRRQGTRSPRITVTSETICVGLGIVLTLAFAGGVGHG